jgi:hypothetical protein
MGNPYNSDSLTQCRSFFAKYHNYHYKIFNASEESEFNIENDLENVENFSFNANNPCSLQTIIQFCESADHYLNLHSENVVALYCRTGFS